MTLPGADYLVRLSAGRVESQGPVSELDKAEIEVEKDDEGEVTQVEEDMEQKKDGVEEAAGKALAREETRTAASSGQGAAVDKKGKLVDEEVRAEGRVKGAVYLLYLKAAGLETWAAIVLLILAGRSFRVVDRWWFKLWGESVSRMLFD